MRKTELIAAATTQPIISAFKAGPDDSRRALIITNERGDPKLCETCRSIDFQKLLTIQDLLRLENPSGVRVARLGSPEDLKARSCRLCHFWEQMRPEFFRKYDREHKRLQGHNRLELVASSLFREYFNSNELDPENDALMLSIWDRPGPEFGPGTGPGIMVTEIKNTTKLNPFTFCCNIISSQADFSTLRFWLNYCKNHHKRCGVFDPLNLRSFHLIDCQRTLETDTLCVISTNQPPPYVALSYVWGSMVDGKLRTMEHPKDRRIETGYQLLPKTIQDAIIITTQLSYNYLWVDKYCIDQTNTQLKHELMQNMHSIYAAAEITIINAAGSSDQDGIPGVNNTPRNTQKQVKIDQNHSLVSIGEPQFSIENSVWATRAWTFQEGLFSRKRLVFTIDEVYFECLNMQCHEILSFPLDVIHNSAKCISSTKLKRAYFSGLAGDSLQDNPYAKYICLLSHYTARKLTYASDRLNAFLGTIESLKPATHHIWGLPVDTAANIKDSFLDSFCWIQSCLQDQEESWSARNCQFPSWTWAAWAEGIQIGQGINTSLMEELAVTFHLEKGTTVQLCDSTAFRDHLGTIEMETPHALTLRTYSLVPNTLEKALGDDGVLAYFKIDGFGCKHSLPLFLHRCETLLDDIRFGRYLLLCVGARKKGPGFYLLVVRPNGRNFERVGCLEIYIWTSEQRKQYLAQLKSSQKYGEFTLV
jgi:heterokaryon incompatibility protein (HET)